MTKAGNTADVSFLGPGDTDELGFMLAQNEDGITAYKRETISLFPESSPPGVPTPDSFPPEVRVRYVIRGGHGGIGRRLWEDGAHHLGLVDGLHTAGQDGFYCGPKIHYLDDVDILEGDGDMETWAAGLPGSWTKINATETVTQETTIVNAGASAARVTSAGAGDGISHNLIHGEFYQCRIRVTAQVYVETGNSPATVQLTNSIGNQSATTTVTDQWEEVQVTLDVSTTALTNLDVDLMPATGNVAIFDEVTVELIYLVGPAGGFRELANSLYHCSGRTTWKLDGHWKATELHSHNVTDLELFDDRLIRAEGASGQWQHSTDGATWTDNGLTGDDRFADKLAVTESIFGTPLLWKSLTPNKLYVSSAPLSGNFSKIVIGASDADIIDLLVVDNILVIIKEDGVWIIDERGIPVNVTADWKQQRFTAAGTGGGVLNGDVFLPVGGSGLVQFDLAQRVRGPVQPGLSSPGYRQYNGQPTRVHGVSGTWLYVFLTDPTSPSPTASRVMRFRPSRPGVWEDLGEVDAGRVDKTWLDGSQQDGDRLYFASKDIDTDAPVQADTGVLVAGNISNTDNSSGREWSNPERAQTDNNSYATWPDESEASDTQSPGTQASQDYAAGVAWSDPANAAASDDADATCLLEDTNTGAQPAGTATDVQTLWTNDANALTSDDSRAESNQNGSINGNCGSFRYTNFGLSVPDDAKILGVAFDVEGQHEVDAVGSGAPTAIWQSYLVLAGTPDFATRRDSGALTDGVDTTETLGGSADTWGQSSLTPADVNDAGFGIHLVGRNTGGAGAFLHHWELDHCTVTVYYRRTYTDGLRLTNFGLTLPADAEPKGIAVSAECAADVASDVNDLLVQLVIGGTLSGDNKASAAYWATSDTVRTYGDSTDLWGLTPTRAQLVAATFGVEIRAKSTGDNDVTASVDHVTIAVHYDTNETSDYLDLQNWGAGVPTGASVDGIKVGMVRHCDTGTVKDSTVQLLNASGVATGDNKASPAAWPTSDTTYSYGGPSDDWGTGFGPTDVNSTSYGVRIAVTGDIKDDVASIDLVNMRIFYTPAAGSDLNNRFGWIPVPGTESPRFSPGYEFATDRTGRTGKITRYADWKTAWQEVVMKTSAAPGEALGSSGRQVTLKYDVGDGSGFVELGGAGNGTFTTSPIERKYFKTALIAAAGVVSEDIELETSLAHDEDGETPVVEEIVLVGTVRPEVVDLWDMTLVVAPNQETLRGGRDAKTLAEKVTRLREMLTPGWATTFYDRWGNSHQVYALPEGGIVEQDILDYRDGRDNPRSVRAIQVRCFGVPNSENWS